MTTVVDFTPSPAAPFQFRATLDGQLYNVIITWNVYRQDWYINVHALDGTLIVSRGLAGSPAAVNIQSLGWATGYASATTDVPHGYVVGDTVSLTISGCVPVAYNGTITAFVVSPTIITWPISADPGPATTLGRVSYDLNLVANYFLTGTLVFRPANQQFEVGP